jgi:hypothetical protein
MVSKTSKNLRGKFVHEVASDQRLLYGGEILSLNDAYWPVVLVRHSEYSVAAVHSITAL